MASPPGPRPQPLPTMSSGDATNSNLYAGEGSHSTDAPRRCQNALQRMMARLPRRHRSARRLAKAIGLSPTSVARGMKRERFSVYTCLKIAKVTGEPVLDVLRWAGRRREAALLSQLTKEDVLLRVDRGLVEKLADLPDDLRVPIRSLVLDCHQRGYRRSR